MEIDKGHSLYSEQLVLTPISKSVPTQFSPFVCKITNTWHVLKKQFLLKIATKGETKIKLHQLKANPFQFPALLHVKYESVARGTKVRFNLFKVQ